MILSQSSYSWTFSETSYPHSISHTLYSGTFHGNYRIFHRCTPLSPHRWTFCINRKLGRKNAKENLNLIFQDNINNEKLGGNGISPCMRLECPYEAHGFSSNLLLVITKSKSKNIQFTGIVPANMFPWLTKGKNRELNVLKEKKWCRKSYTKRTKYLNATKSIQVYSWGI